MKPSELYICNFKLGDIPYIAGALTDTDVVNLENYTINALDIIELRVDMFKKTALDHIVATFRMAKEKFRKPVIATVRDPKEGGEKEIEDRLAIFRAVMPYADLVDIEINSGEMFGEVQNLCLNEKKVLISSYHNFISTPADNVLEELVTKGKDLGADVVKIAVTAGNSEDMTRLGIFTYMHRDKGLITISMGDKGMPSRVFTPLFGSLITYGYVTHPSAPGQLSVSELMYIFRRLKIR